MSQRLCTECTRQLPADGGKFYLGMTWRNVCHPCADTIKRERATIYNGTRCGNCMHSLPCHAASCPQQGATV